MEAQSFSRSSTLHIDTSRFCVARPHPSPPDGAPREGAERSAVDMETLFYDAATGWSAPLPALDSEGTLLMVFGGGALGSVVAPVEDLVRAYPKSRLVGCSRPSHAQGPDTVSVTFMRFNHTHLHVVCVPVTPPTSGDDAARTLGERVAGELLAPALRGVMLFPGAPGIDNRDLLRSARAALPRAVTLTSFADGVQSWAVGWGRPQRNVVAAVGLYGERVVFD